MGAGVGAAAGTARARAHPPNNTRTCTGILNHPYARNAHILMHAQTQEDGPEPAACEPGRAAGGRGANDSDYKNAGKGQLASGRGQSVPEDLDDHSAGKGQPGPADADGYQPQHLSRSGRRCYS